MIKSCNISLWCIMLLRWQNLVSQNVKCSEHQNTYCCLYKINVSCKLEGSVSRTSANWHAKFCQYKSWLTGDKQTNKKQTNKQQQQTNKKQNKTKNKKNKKKKKEYASSDWIGATPTSLAQLDSIQNRAKRVISLPSNEYEDYRIQPLSHRRAVGAATLFYRIFYKEAPELWCQLMPDINVHDPRLRRSVRSHDLAVEVSRSNLVSHAR